MIVIKYILHKACQVNDNRKRDMGVNENKGNVMIVYARFTQNRSKNCFYCCSTTLSLIRLFILEGKWQLSKSIGFCMQSAY